MSEHNTCWCGNKNLLDFSSAYFCCTSCGTLVLRDWPDGDVTNVQDAGELYSQDYYLKHLPQEYGYPSLEARARTDISERVLFWIETLLRYKLPPSKVLELGSAHGGFVAMMRQAGFDAAGLELSPWLVRFSKTLFEIPVFQGPLENQDIAPSSLGAIILMDVLEHLPDPIGTMRLALDMLLPDGILLIQTPRFPEEKTFNELQETQDAFLVQFKEKEHLFLFSSRSVQQFFSQLGCSIVIFEPAIFTQYDMFFVVSKISVRQNSLDDIQQALQKTSKGRIMQGFLDLYNQSRTHLSQLQDAHAQLQKVDSQLQDAHAQLQKTVLQLQKTDLQLREVYADLQIARQTLNALRNSRLYKVFRRFGFWAWMDNILNQLEQ
jgi:SAM-dependent methyltransferase